MPTRHHSTAAPRLGFIATAAALAAIAAVAFLLLRPGAGNAAQSSGAMVSTAKTSLGRILVNSSGRTLYLFGKDKNGKSACTGQCAARDHRRRSGRRARGRRGSDAGAGMERRVRRVQSSADDGAGDPCGCG